MVLLENAQVFDGERRLPPNHSVLIEGRKIGAVAPGADFEGYAGLRVNLLGYTVLPGLIDCHVHLVLTGDLDVWGPLRKASPAQLALRALESAQRCLRGGVTSIRDCGGMNHIELDVRDAINGGAFFGPTVRAAGQFICMCGGTNHPVARVADGEHEVRVAVREQIGAGCDFVKLMATGAVLTSGTNIDDVQFTAEELRAGVVEASRLGRRSAIHAIGAAGVLNAAQAGATSIEHAVFLTDRAIDEMVSRGTWVVPTLGAVARLLAHGDALPPEILDKAQRVSAAHRESIGRFYRAGGKIAMGGDTGTPFNAHGENAWELSEMVAAGMPAGAALIAATSSASALMNLPDRGYVRPGLQADLLIVQGDPFHDIRQVADPSKHLCVIKSGSLVQAGRLWGALDPATHWMQ